MNRRTFSKYLSASLLYTGIQPAFAKSPGLNSRIRLGGPVFGVNNDPDQWIGKLKAAGFTAAYCPVGTDADAQTIRSFREVAQKNKIIIAEVGAWSNMVSPDPEEYRKSIEKCTSSLQLAEEIGANCCVNVSGSRNPEHWAGPHQDNFSADTFDLVVETTRKVIDAVKPSRTYFTLEMMPWAFPFSTDTYLDLLQAIDRKAFAVHLDPVNMVTSPKLYYSNGEMIREAFQKLGPHIRSCHAKDITLREDNYIPQMDEVRPGLGNLNYQVYLAELAKLNDIPLMMEHLKTEEEYRQAANYIRSVGREAGLNF